MNQKFYFQFFLAIFFSEGRSHGLRRRTRSLKGRLRDPDSQILSFDKTWMFTKAFDKHRDRNYRLALPLQRSISEGRNYFWPRKRTTFFLPRNQKFEKLGEPSKLSYPVRNRSKKKGFSAPNQICRGMFGIAIYEISLHFCWEKWDPLAFYCSCKTESKIGRTEIDRKSKIQSPKPRPKICTKAPSSKSRLRGLTRFQKL